MKDFEQPAGCFCFLRLGDKEPAITSRPAASPEPVAQRTTKPMAISAQPKASHGAVEAHPGAPSTRPQKQTLEPDANPSVICLLADATNTVPSRDVPEAQPSQAPIQITCLPNPLMPSTEAAMVHAPGVITADDASGKVADPGHQATALCPLSRSSSASTTFFSVAGWSDFGDSESLMQTPRPRTSSIKLSDDGTSGSRLTDFRANPSKSSDRTHCSLNSETLHDAIAVADGTGRPGPAFAPHTTPYIAAVAAATPPQALSNTPSYQPAATTATTASVAASTTTPTATTVPAVAQHPHHDGSADTRSATLDRVADLYGAQGRPCRACQVLLQFCKTHGEAPESLQQELRARQLPDATGLTRIVQGVTECLADVASDEGMGWHVVRNDELRLLYKHMSGPGIHAFRARATLEAPLEHLLATAREVDLCPTWNKYCTSARVLKESSVTDVMVYMSLWMPWPLVGVGFLLEAAGADLFEEEGCLVVIFNSTDKEKPGMELPPGADKHRRIRLLPPSCLTFRPLPPATPGGPPRTECCVQSYVDPGMRHVPGFIIAFVLKVLSPFMFHAVKKVLTSAFAAASNPLPTRILQRQELYEMVRQRAADYLKRLEERGGQEPVVQSYTAGANVNTVGGKKR